MGCAIQGVQPLTRQQDTHLVAHVQSAHELQHDDLQGEVERSDQRHRAVRPTQTLGLLAHVVPGHSESAREEAHLHSDCEGWSRRLRIFYIPSRSASKIELPMLIMK